MFDEEKAKKNYYEKIKKHIEPHIEALSIKREQLVYTNEYGVEETDKWRLELGKYIREVLLPSQDKLIFLTSRRQDPLLHDFLFEMKFTRSGATPTKKSGKRVTEVFDKAIEEHIFYKKTTSSKFTINTKEHSLYEHDCCKVIKSFGWDAKVTPGSGDQGVDIIAEKHGKKIAFQCKLYHSQPVGNSAVQQVKSGGNYFKCNSFAVISNNYYSTSAKQLASSLGVKLMHHSEIEGFLSSFLTNDNINHPKERALSNDYSYIFNLAIKGDIPGASSTLNSMSEDEKNIIFEAANIILKMK